MQKFKNMTIKRRMLLIIIATSLVYFVISSVSILLSIQQKKNHLTENLTSIAEMISDNCLVSITYDIPEDTQTILSSLKRRPSVTYAVITDATGSRFADYTNAKLKKTSPPLPPCSTDMTSPGSATKDGYLYVWLPILLDNSQIGILHLFDNMSFVSIAIKRNIINLCIFLTIVTVVSFFMAISLHHFIATPLEHLSGLTKQIYDSGNYSLRAEKETGGEIGTLVVSFNDMLDNIQNANTKLESLVSELEDKNMELERFTYTVSHELKSPLITIKGFVGQLQKHIKKDPSRIDKDIMRIENAADKMHNLLNDLLELSRIGRIIGDVMEVKFNDIVSDALSRLTGPLEESGVEVCVDEDMPAVTVDTMRFSEVIQNLVENSIKFTKDETNPKISVGCRVENNINIFFVSDNGTGIPEEYRDKVFGLFEQLEHKQGGTGIGLAIIKRIIETHNGRIWVEETEGGHGATFCFTVHETQTEHDGAQR